MVRVLSAIDFHREGAPCNEADLSTSEEEKYCERTTCITLIDHYSPICVACYYNNVAFLALLVRVSLGLHFNGSSI